MKIQQENIREYPKIREIREHFLSWTIPIIRYVQSGVSTLVCGNIYHLYTRYYLLIHCIIHCGIIIIIFRWAEQADNLITHNNG